ncbi:MAG: SDR family oxidoreductase [Chloroflexi bacterium]|nr:SDR family oxidoreductase [Chloroflexota bacterium]
MHYIVTGGAGFIGSHLAERLLNDGNTVTIVDNLLTGKSESVDRLMAKHGKLLTFANMSITDPGLPEVVAGADTIFHEAALPSVPRSIDFPLETHHHCVTGTLHVLEAARKSGVRRVVYAASSSAYGEQEGEYKREDMTPQPISPYGVAKLAGEMYCQVFTRVYGLETVCLRYFNVFGPRQDPASQYAAVIPRFITAMLRGERPTIYGDGQQSRDFTYIDNVVHGNLLASRSPDAVGQMMNLATGGQVSLLALVDKINALLGTELEPEFLPAREGDIKHSQAAVDKARDLLDFSPIVNFDEGLRRTVAFYEFLA